MRDLEEPLRFHRYWSISVKKLIPHRCPFVLILAGRDLRVDLEPETLRRNIGFRKECVNGQLDAHVRRLLLSVRRSRPQLRHGLRDHPHVKVKANPRNLTRLLAAQHVAGSTDLQILHRDLDSGSQISVGSNRAQALKCRLRHGAIRLVEEVGIGPFPAASYASTKLVQLGESKLIRVLHDQSVRVGDV